MTDLDTQYRERFHNALVPISSAIEQTIRNYLVNDERIDRISARAKSIDRFLEKGTALKDDGSPKYPDPINDIQDQIGARIITFYKSDVLRLAARVEKYFRAIEAKDRVPETESEFGYFGRHYIFFVPSDVVGGYDRALLPKVFELQIKTLFQHAWSEANHDLGYKPGDLILTSEDKRKLAFTSAQAWGADMIFDELFIAQEAARHDAGP